MMRDGLAADAAHVSAVVQGNRIRLLDRASAGGNTTDALGHNQGAPEWIRIERSGSTFTLSRSNDGSSWAVMDTRTISMGTMIYIGMAVTGNSTTTLATGVFDNVATTGSGATPTPTATNTPLPTNTPTATNTPVSTNTPTPTNTPAPSPTPAPDVWIKRSSYGIAGQMVAFRVTGDPVSANNGLFYVLSDHLGSTSLLVNSSGGTVTGSTTRYLPFGGYRGTAPSQTITDRDFTGQKENMELGLLYFQARFYVPGIGRFASADTLVPDPANPQAYNRYSYVENRPLNFNDPTGHCKNGKGIGTGTCQVDGGPGFADGSLIQTGDNVPQVLTNSELGTLGTAASFVPYLDTGDDIATAFTGCGYACQAGSEEPVGLGWRSVAAIGIVAPFSSSMIRHGADEVVGWLSHFGDDIVEATGQWHHVLSNKIYTELGWHETLAGIFGRNDIMVQALDRESHNGYQTWHRLYDDAAVEWLQDSSNVSASPTQFVQYLRGVYERSDMQQRFPGAIQLIDMVLEELP